MNIYLDIHGVLCDFNAGLVKSLRLRHVDYPPGEYDLNKIYKRQVDLSCYSASWWANLPRTRECSSILEMCLAYAGKGNVKLVTKPASATCMSGTAAWVASNCSFLYHDLITMKDKYLLVKTVDDILIDDSDQNIEKWEHYGGTGILVPRIWNKLWEKERNVLDHIEHALMRFERDAKNQDHA